MTGIRIPDMGLMLGNDILAAESRMRMFSDAAVSAALGNRSLAPDTGMPEGVESVMGYRGADLPWDLQITAPRAAGQDMAGTARLANPYVKVGGIWRTVTGDSLSHDLPLDPGGTERFMAVYLTVTVTGTAVSASVTWQRQRSGCDLSELPEDTGDGSSSTAHIPLYELYQTESGHWVVSQDYRLAPANPSASAYIPLPEPWDLEVTDGTVGGHAAKIFRVLRPMVYYGDRLVPLGGDVAYSPFVGDKVGYLYAVVTVDTSSEEPVFSYELAGADDLPGVTAGSFVDPSRHPVLLYRISDTYEVAEDLRNVHTWSLDDAVDPDGLSIEAADHLDPETSVTTRKLGLLKFQEDRQPPLDGETTLLGNLCMNSEGDIVFYREAPVKSPYTEGVDLVVRTKMAGNGVYTLGYMRAFPAGHTTTDKVIPGGGSVPGKTVEMDVCTGVALESDTDGWKIVPKLQKIKFYGEKVGSPSDGTPIRVREYYNAKNTGV